MTITEPYFMTNPEWYIIVNDGDGVELTELGKKIPKVVRSYKDYYEELERIEGQMPGAED